MLVYRMRKITGKHRVLMGQLTGKRTCLAIGGRRMLET